MSRSLTPRRLRTLPFHHPQSISTSKFPDELWLTRADFDNDNPKAFVGRCVDLLESPHRKVTVCASGSEIGLAVAIVEAVKRRVVRAHQISELMCGRDTLTHNPPREIDELSNLPREQPSLRITLTRDDDAAQSSHPGYQAPLPAAEGAPDADISAFLTLDPAASGSDAHGGSNNSSWASDGNSARSMGSGAERYRGGWLGSAPRQGHGEGRPQWASDAAYRRRGGGGGVSYNNSFSHGPPRPHLHGFPPPQYQQQQSYYPHQNARPRHGNQQQHYGGGGFRQSQQPWGGPYDPSLRSSAGYSPASSGGNGSC